MRNTINFNTEEILEKLSIDELIFELKRRGKEEEIREIAFNYILSKAGYHHEQIERICEVLSKEARHPNFNKINDKM